MCAFPSELHDTVPAVERMPWTRGNLVEEAALDVEPLPKVKHHPFCNERAGKRKELHLFSIYYLANKGQKQLLCFFEAKELKVALQPAVHKDHGWVI